MSISKDTYERARSKAQARILEWTDEAKASGTTRLLDQNGGMLKRIEYKGKDDGAKSKNIKALETNDKFKAKQRSSKDTGSVVTSTTRGRCGSGQNGGMLKPIEYKGKDDRAKSKNIKALETNDKSKAKQRSSKDTGSVVISTTRDRFGSGQTSNVVKQNNRTSQNKHTREKSTKTRGIETASNLRNDEAPGTYKLPPISQSTVTDKSRQTSDIVKQHSRNSRNKHPRGRVTKTYGIETALNVRNNETAGSDKLPPISQPIPGKENCTKLRHDQNSSPILHTAAKSRSTPYSTTPQEKLDDDEYKGKTAKQADIDYAVKKIMRESSKRRKKKTRSAMRRDQDDEEWERSVKTHEQQTHLLPESQPQFNGTSEATQTVAAKQKDKLIPSLQSARTNYKEPNKDPRLKAKKTRKTLKRCVRKVLNILYLLRLLKQRVKADLLTECQYQMGVDKRKALERMSFDPGYFRPVTSIYRVGLSNSARRAFWKPVSQRTAADTQIIMEVINRLPCFAKYPQSVREELAKVAWYDQFDNDRVLLRQGHVGSRMYFVISGCASVQSTEGDSRSKSKSRHLYDIHPWSSFGELALVRNKVDFTVICKGKSEFLSLCKDEFNSILRIYYDDAWNKRYNFFRTSVYFKNLSDDQIQEMADMSEIKEISHNRIVHGNTRGQSLNVFFIYSGKCEIQKKVSFVRCVSPYVPPALISRKPKAGSLLCRREYHYFTVLRLKEGDYFGVGEDLLNMFIISKGKAGIIFLRASTFNSNYSVTHVDNLQEERRQLIHSSPELIKRFKNKGKWMVYKKKVIEEVIMRLRRKNTNCVSYSDVPGIKRNQQQTPYPRKRS